MTDLLSTLPPLPDRMRRLPVDQRGYPVPWFVSWLDEAGQAVRRGSGTPDFRVITWATIVHAVNYRACWICGESLGAFVSFVIGPMCAVNRISSEPPSHLDCADFAARACPFLVKPQMKRRETNLPGDGPAGGIMIRRNPGVALVWTTRRYSVRPDGNGGAVFQVGDPDHVRWYAEGKPASRAAVLQSIDDGLPTLRELAADEQEQREIDRALAKALALVPEGP